MPQPRPYYAPEGLSAVHYDLVTAADTRLAGDVDIYAALATPPATVLELGCGTGRLAFALAARGFLVSGVDLAPAMLDQARSRKAEVEPALAVRTEFLESDLTRLDLGRAFDLVLCPFFTLAHLPPQLWPEAFAGMARHLARGGKAAVHLPLAAIMRLPGPPPTLAVMDAPLTGGGRLRLYVGQRQFDEAAGRLDQVIDYVELDGAGRVRRRSAEQLTYHLADPIPLAAAAGLALSGAPIPLGGVGEILVFEHG